MLLYIKQSMGCDYYTWIETIIVYKDLSGATRRFVEQGEKQRCYEELDDIDTDFKVPPTTGQILAEEIRVYGKKIMFADGKWLCHLNGKNRIRDLCAAEKLPFDGIIEVFKQMDGRVA